MNDEQDCLLAELRGLEDTPPELTDRREAALTRVLSALTESEIIRLCRLAWDQLPDDARAACAVQYCEMTDLPKKVEHVLYVNMAEWGDDLRCPACEEKIEYMDAETFDVQVYCDVDMTGTVGRVLRSGRCCLITDATEYNEYPGNISRVSAPTMHCPHCDTRLRVSGSRTSF